MVAALHPTLNPLDIHVGMMYRVTRPGGCKACLPAPRERSFIVVEDHGLEISGSGGYCAYILAKRGLSSHDAARLLAKLLGARPGSVKLLGLKDAEATTVQLAILPCGRDMPAHVRVEGRLWARFAGRVEELPRPGRLRGNSFTILVSPVGCTASRLAEKVEELAGGLLPAYYSYQRFGSRRPNSHLVGLMLLRGDLRGAWEEIVAKLYPDESPQARLCRAARWVLDGCRMPWAYEPLIAEKPAERLLDIMPRPLAEIFSSAVQAYIFNLYLSARIEWGYELTERVKGERLTADGRPLAPVPGVGYRIGVSGEARRLLRRALEEAGLGEEELARAHWKLRSGPYWRPVYTRLKALRVAELGGLVVVRFWLERGMYATLLLRELIDYPDEMCGSHSPSGVGGGGLD
jgi:tRNA pseudouridine13 synthase